MKSGIYLIKNIVNNKVYVGQSQDIEYRLRKHREALRANRHTNKHLQNSWNKYGEICFEFIISQYCSIEQLTWQEQATFDYFKNFVKMYNFGNFTDSPTRGKRFLLSDDIKKKLSLSKIGDKNPMKRKEVRNKVSKALLGKKLSEERKANMRRSSPKIRPERFRKVERIDLFTGEIKEYHSLQSLKDDGFSNLSVGKVCRNEPHRHSYKKYGWKFLEE